MPDNRTASQAGANGNVDCSALLNVGTKFDLNTTLKQQMVDTTATVWDAYLASQHGNITPEIIAGFANYVKSRIPAGSGHGGAL